MRAGQGGQLGGSSDSPRKMAMAETRVRAAGAESHRDGKTEPAGRGGAGAWRRVARESGLSPWGVELAFREKQIRLSGLYRGAIRDMLKVRWRTDFKELAGYTVRSSWDGSWPGHKFRCQDRECRQKDRPRHGALGPRTPCSPLSHADLNKSPD